MAENSKRNIYAELSTPLCEDAIQRTEKEKTYKAYDTTGYGYQFCIDKLNEVLGIDGWDSTYQILDEHIEETSTKKKKYYFTVNVDIILKANDELGLRETKKSCAGGHSSLDHSDGLKGAITNAFKKAAAFYGVGRDAYAGTIDNDNRPDPEDKQELPAPAAKSEKPEPKKEEKKEEPKPESKNGKIKPEYLTRLIKGKNLLGLEFDKILKNKNIKNIESIPNDKIAIEIVNEALSAYENAVNPKKAS